MFKRHEQPIHKKSMELAPNLVKNIFNLMKVSKIILKFPSELKLRQKWHT